ncbi:7SK snRNA methylphosphate capping enzyme-like isoform X2 [Osmerus eperlanus]|uniref:7SK snRNA methylphosphate capping enzyme-like isoform X2 n=1 Tax=Osmerus eperlanus TaxID=29151 RepID=UPI002E0FC05C
MTEFLLGCLSLASWTSLPLSVSIPAYSTVYSFRSSWRRRKLHAIGQHTRSPTYRKKMIRMSLDKETVLSRDPVLPACPGAGGGALNDQSNSLVPKPGKTRPLCPKNGIQAPPTPQAPPPASQQRMAKRRYSVGVGFKHPGFSKRRRRANSDSQSEPSLPTNFLLGGNIFDPLNLNSLLDEEVSRTLNAATPQSSPLPARARDPVQILVPRDITDPLNLKSGGPGGLLLSPLKSRKRHRNRHHGADALSDSARSKVAGELGLGAQAAAVPAPSREGSVASPLPYELNTSINCRDEVVPPILPRRHTHPGPSSKTRHHVDGHRPRKRRRTTSARSEHPPSLTPPPPSFHTPLGAGPQRHKPPPPPPRKKNKYLHGNFSRYYGYRGCYGAGGEGRVGPGEDPRLDMLQPDWFRGKMALDIGCGTGHMTLAIARRFGPAHILGVDMDEHLVHAARKNIRHFLSQSLAQEAEEKGGGGSLEDPGKQTMAAGVDGSRREERGEEGREEKGEEELQRLLTVLGRPPDRKTHAPFPLSLRVTRGPLAAPPLAAPPHPGTFPHNVTFLTGNYVMDREAELEQYDVILCLGVAKWVHLHHGDWGVTRLFRRAYQSLRPGGHFLLEAQSWSSYCHSKRTSVRHTHCIYTLNHSYTLLNTHK